MFHPLFFTFVAYHNWCMWFRSVSCGCKLWIHHNWAWWIAMQGCLWNDGIGLSPRKRKKLRSCRVINLTKKTPNFQSNNWIVLKFYQENLLAQFYRGSVFLLQMILKLGLEGVVQASFVIFPLYYRFLSLFRIFFFFNFQVI